MPARRTRSGSLLLWLNLFLAVLCLMPCCVLHQFPFLAGEIIHRVHQPFPEEGQLTAAELFAVPFGFMYAVQFVLVGLPALFAGVCLWRRSPLGWWLAVAAASGQTLLFLANTLALLLLGPFAVKYLGAAVAFPLYALQFTLLAAHLFLISTSPPHRQP